MTYCSWECSAWSPRLWRVLLGARRPIPEPALRPGMNSPAGLCRIARCRQRDRHPPFPWNGSLTGGDVYRRLGRDKSGRPWGRLRDGGMDPSPPQPLWWAGVHACNPVFGEKEMQHTSPHLGMSAIRSVKVEVSARMGSLISSSLGCKASCSPLSGPCLSARLIRPTAARLWGRMGKEPCCSREGG